MKKTILLILSILFILAACAEKTPQTDAVLYDTSAERTEETEPAMPPVLTGDEDTFYLSYLPDIGEYEAEDAPERWYADYMGELIPSDEYGELIPYIGYERKFVFEMYDETAVKYAQYFGLCTTDGVIVTDPVYINVTENSGYYLLQSQPIYEERRIYHKFYLAAKDGSSFIELDGCANVCYYVGNGIYCSREAYESVDGLQYINRDGTVLWEVDYLDLSGIPDLVGSADDVVIMHDYSARTFYFVDGYMRCTSALFKRISYATHDRYIVEELENGKYGIIDLNGEYILPSEYDYIDYDEGRYLLCRDGKSYVTDETFSVIATFERKASSSSGLIGPYIVRFGYLEFFDLRKESYPDEVYYYGVYSYEENSVIYLMDDEGRSIGQIPGRGHVISATDDNRYICLWISRDNGEQVGGYRLYDAETGELSDILVFVSDKHYGRKMSEDVHALYTIDGVYLHDYNGKFTCLDIADEEYYYYTDGDYAYTEDAEGNIIVKRRAVFD